MIEKNTAFASITDSKGLFMGVVSLSEINLHLTKTYGQEINGNKAVSNFLQKNPRVFNLSAKAIEIVQLIIDSGNLNLDDICIIDNYRKPCGFVCFLSLLKLQQNEINSNIKKLESQKKLLKAADEHKQDFINLMSHELRTPINGIFGVVQLLEGMEELKDIQPLVSLQKDSTLKLMRILDSIFDFVSITKSHNAQKFETTHISKVLADTYDLYKDRYETEDLKLNLEVDPNAPESIKTCKKSFIRIISNLLDNAFKFTSKGIVTLKYYSSGQKIIIEISDTGIGIEAKHHDRIFEPFHQVDSSIIRNYEGVGIGLTVAKMLTSELKGKISVTSHPETGSTFFVEIPSTDKLSTGKNRNK